jgi:hypothetical protein
MEDFGFQDKLWEAWPIIFSRSKSSHLYFCVFCLFYVLLNSTLEQLIVRYTKNYMSEKAYFENIKSRKFQPLGVLLNLFLLYHYFKEEGTYAKVWMELKVFHLFVLFIFFLLRIMFS